MGIRTQKVTKTGRRGCRSSNSEHNDTTPRVLSQIPPHIGDKQENGNEWNKQIRWSQVEME